jgi:hypothetical protein
MKNIDDMTGSDIRNYIKQMWKHDKKVYDELIDYLAEYDKEDVRNKLIEHCNEKKYTFSDETLIVLRPVFSNMQADVIKESMPFLMYIMGKLDKGKGSKKSKKNTFKKSVSQKNFLKKSLIKKSKKNTFKKSVSQNNKKNKTKSKKKIK